ncbi:MAG: hypothetical protein K8H88_08635 [Sandaracinaceae bacterium]|nr:hypothetical protein [Sandaracinaceae bacterium]
MSSERIRLEILDVREPCTEAWSGMAGDDRKRFCGICKQDVFNLSAMTCEEAEALVTRAEGRVCVRFHRRADGTVTTRDCAPRLLEASRRRARRVLGVAAVAVAGVMSLIGGAGVAVASSSSATARLREWAEALDPTEPVIMGQAVVMPDPSRPAEPSKPAEPAEPEDEP